MIAINDIDKLLPQLHEPHKKEIETRLAVAHTHLRTWQEHARYERTFTPTPQTFTEITQAAFQVALYTAKQLPGQKIATRVHHRASFIQHRLARLDLHTGENRNEGEGPGYSFDL